MEEKLEVTDYQKGEIIDLLRPYGVKKIAIFGSRARGDATQVSDLDIIVWFDKPLSLMKLVQIEEELKVHLQIKVDLLTNQAISTYLQEIIQSEQVVIFG